MAYVLDAWNLVASAANDLLGNSKHQVHMPPLPYHLLAGESTCSSDNSELLQMLLLTEGRIPAAAAAATGMATGCPCCC